MDETSRGERLHKFLARAGIASRREAENLILQGRVTVNSEVVTELGRVIDPEKDKVRFDGERVAALQAVVFAVYKPKGVVCTTDDQFSRKTVIDLLDVPEKKRLFTVGRLEEDSEGLILVTNDGEFAQAMLSRKNPVRQTYFVRLRGTLTQEAIEKLRGGLWLSDGRTGPMHLKILRSTKKVTSALATPSAQQHRLLRRVFAKVSVQLDRVVRVRIGSLSTEGLKERGFRKLSATEIHALLHPAAEDLVATLDFGARARLNARAPSARTSRGRPLAPGRGKAPTRERARGNPTAHEAARGSDAVRPRRVIGGPGATQNPPRRSGIRRTPRG